MDSCRQVPQLHSGDALPEVVKYLDQEKINCYAGVVDDFNPIHVDEAFAAQTQFGGTIAHGMLILAYISEMMTLAFGESWFSTGELSVRFKSPACSRDTVVVSGKVELVAADEDGLNFKCSINCKNQDDSTIVKGSAMVKMMIGSRES